ncbi:hypothetical protein SUGI_1009220 [Cryptomeria japonica]|nr:hypothetical protein SUGI_1009220 [Cryptomeria japonica]
MDGKDDLHHNQGEDEEYTSDKYFCDSDELEDENQVTDFFEQEHHEKKINIYTVVKEEDICQRQEEGMVSVCSILSISRDEAVILLLHFGWDFQRVIDEWLVKEEDIRRDLGLFKTRVSEVDPNSVMECGVCGDSFSINGMRGGTCEHYFCIGCWLNWIQEIIDQAGARCLRLKCLEPFCKCSLGQEMVLSLLVSCEERYLKMYRQYLVRSYVESKKTIKWCPAPGCEYAVEVGNHGSGSGSYEVTCECCYEFCWNCLEEAHGPVDCEIAKKSMLENNDFGKTENWKLVNTKRCPKCNSAIEKGGGCRHMTCVFPCCFEFCWFCLGNWFDHDAHYACDWYYDS